MNHKDLSLQDTLDHIEKQWGKGAICRLGDSHSAADVSVISTGSLRLDDALGVGGFPLGRIIEIYGPESSGKTTVALQTIAQAQKEGGMCAFIDTEHALDPQYAKNLGVQPENLLVAQPDTAEQALEMINDLVRSGHLRVIVLDSVAALVPKAELEGEMGDTHVGLHARLMSQALRKLTGLIAKTSCLVIFINQIRHKIGVMFGSPETTTGGNALKFYASVRLDVRRIASLKNKERYIGNTVRIKVVKNKVAPPFRVVEMTVLYGEGFSHVEEVIAMATESNILNKAGSWYSYQEKNIAQGKESLKEYFEKNPDVFEEISQKTKEHLKKQRSAGSS